MAFQATKLPQQRGLVIQFQESLTSNPINTDKGLVADSSTTQILIKKETQHTINRLSLKEGGERQETLLLQNKEMASEDN